MVSKETRMFIVQKSINQIEASIYDLTIQARVANKVSDEKVKKRCMDEMGKFEKMLDEYTKILAELEDEIEDVDNDGHKIDEAINMLEEKEIGGSDRS